MSIASSFSPVGLGQITQRGKCLVEIRNGLAIGAACYGAKPRLAEIGDRLLPQFPVQGVVGQPLGLLGDALARKPLDRLGNARVQITSPVLQQPLVRHLVRERMLERVLEIGKEPDLVKELRALQVGQLGAHLVLRRVGNGEQQRQGYNLADDGSSLE
jgi:hypothetical protein